MERSNNSKHIVKLLNPGILVLFLVVLAPLHAQVSGPVILGFAAEDSAWAAIMYRQAMDHYGKGRLDTALDAAGEALHAAMRSDREDIEVSTLRLIAAIYREQNLPGDAIPYYMRIANTLETRGDTTELQYVYRSIAQLYHLEEVYDKEGEYYTSALRLCGQNHTGEKAELTEKIGVAYLAEGMYDSAAVYLQAAKDICGEKDRTRILGLLVKTYNRSDQYEEALRCNRLLFDRYLGSEDYEKMSAVKNNIGYNLTFLGEYEQAASEYQEAIRYGEQAGIPQKDLAGMMANAGICYQNMKRNKEARPYFQQAVRAYSEAGRPAEKSHLENMLALVYYHEGDLYNAGLFSRNSIESAREASDPAALSEGYLTYSRILREGNDPIKALEYYERYLDIRDSLELEEKLREQDLARRKYQLEKSEKDLKIKLKEEQVRELAIQQLTLQLEKEEQEKELMRKENDVRLLEQERLRQSLVITQQEHAAERQRRQNQILEQEKSIAELRLQQEVREKERQEQEIMMLEQQKKLDQLEIARSKTARNVLIGFVIVVVLITGLIVASLISSRRKNILLAKQKEEIEGKNRDLENKNEEIIAQRDEIEAQRDLVSRQKDEIEQYNLEVMKSIEYARKIQSSTLPDLSSLNTSISEYFVFFRPRDIVSGDFFWTATVEDTTVLTVSDCTGHGVPGAFMSMLGMSLLKEIVQKEYITLPGVVLRRLRKGIIAALGQKGISGEQRDGMDMSLVSIDHASRKVQFAGAYNPLYLVRKKNLPVPQMEGITEFEDETEGPFALYEVKADKMPIGYYDHMDKFATRELDMLEEDNFYLFTDGFADQFGGPKGKKFKYKPFKRLLLSNAHLSMQEQEEVLNNTLEKWMGNIAQVDDICIIGLRIGKGS